MYSIIDLIAERQRFAMGAHINPWKDELLAHIIEQEKKEDVAFLSVGSTLFDKRKIKSLQAKYHIVGAYRIGTVFTSTNVPFYIIHLSKTPSTGLKVALFNGKCYSARIQKNNTCGDFATPESYTEEWVRYTTRLEEWMNGGTIPESNDLYEFGFVPSEQLLEGSFWPETYSRENIELRELMDQQDTRVLSDLAKISVPKVERCSVEAVKVLKVKDLIYPFDVSKLDMDKPTNIILQKGDVIIPRIKTKTKAYLYNYDGKERIYASQNLVVIKCKEILPEYLYLYLSSDVAVKVLNARYIGVCIHHVTAKEIAELPIAVPTQDEHQYIADFNTLTNLGLRDYTQLQEVNAYYDHLSRVRNKEEKPNSVEDILNLDVVDSIRVFKEEQLRTFLSDDLRELNACYRSKAYKATLILAGSILEAVLIDWVSELHNKNYFETDYYVFDRYGKRKRADLIDYINEIKALRRPHWMVEADKAHEIRKKRNMVHAKLCLKSEDINEEICKKVISYLNDVLKTRGASAKR